MEKKSLVEQVFVRPKNGIIPTLLNFQNGNLASTGKEQVQYCTMLDKRTKSKEAFVAVEGNIYTGSINANESNVLTDMYICVRNKGTNKVRILPIDEAKLKNYIYDEIQENEIKSNKPIDDLAIRKKRIKEFSGKKASRALANTEKMQISIEVVKDDLDVTVGETTVNEMSMDTERETYSEIICPKFNKVANKVNEVYDINDLVPPELLSRLDREAEAIFTTSNENLPIKSEFLMGYLQKIKQSSIPKLDILHKIKIVIFMDCLFNLITSKVRNLRNTELSGITARMENYIRHQFSADGLIQFQQLKDKALCYYIVLCALIEETYSVDITMLGKEFKRRQVDIKKLAHVANLLPMKTKKGIVNLTLPSKVPALKTMGNKRNRKSI